MCFDPQDLDGGNAKGPQGALDEAIATGTRNYQSLEMAALGAAQTVVLEGGPSDGDLMVTENPIGGAVKGPEDDDSDGVGNTGS